MTRDKVVYDMDLPGVVSGTAVVVVKVVVIVVVMTVDGVGVESAGVVSWMVSCDDPEGPIPTMYEEDIHTGSHGVENGTRLFRRAVETDECRGFTAQITRVESTKSQCKQDSDSN